MIDNIILTPGTVIVMLSWICGTIYALVRKDIEGIEYAFGLTVLYGIYRLLLYNIN